MMQKIILDIYICEKKDPYFTHEKNVYWLANILEKSISIHVDRDGKLCHWYPHVEMA